MEKDLITNYVDGESTNDRLNKIRLAREYNLILKNNLGFVSAVAPSEIAYAHNQAPTIDYSNRSFGEAATDMWRMFYNNMQQAQIDSNDAEINSATLNMEDTKFLMDYNDAVNGNITPQEFTQQHGISLAEAGFQAQETLNRLRQDGVYTGKSDPTNEALLDIYNDNNELLIDAQERRNANYKLLVDSLDVHDISQYATQKSNESAYTVGNFLYKTAALLGSSSADWDWQTLSMIAGMVATVWASTKVGATGGASVGALGGPGGAVAGGAVGGLVGLGMGIANAWRAANMTRNLAVGVAAAGASEAAGGIQSRQGEARMEAYARYAENMDLALLQFGINKDELIAKGRRYAANNQVNVPKEQLDRMSDDDIYKLIINGTIPVNDNNFEHARRQAYRGTLSLYEKNMSLEAGDVLTDMLYYVPGLRQSKVFRSIANPIEAPYHLTKEAIKKARNPFNKLLTKRNRLNSDIVREALPDIAKALKPLTGKSIAKRIRKDDLKAYASAQFAGMTEEATEEGSQYIRSDMASQGEFDDRLVSTSLFDAMINGNLAEDLLEGWATRARSTLAVFTPFDPIYSNDEELRENYIAGGVLSFSHPTALVTGARDLYNIATNYKKDKQFADIFARALDEQDFVDRSVDLLLSVRQLNKSGRRYIDVLDKVSEMMKSGKYDLGTISDLSEGSVTEQDIDDFINDEKKQFGLLMGVKNAYGPKAVELGMTEYDQDIYTAIAYDAILNTEDQRKQARISNDELNSAVKQAFEGDTSISKQINDNVENLIKLDGGLFDESSRNYMTEAIRALADINKRIEHATKQSQKFGNIAEGYAFLKANGLSTVENAEQLKSLLDSANNELAILMLEKQRILNDISKKVTIFNRIKQLELNLESYKSIDLSKEPDIDTDGLEVYQNWYNAILNKYKELAELDKLTKLMNNIINTAEKIEISDAELDNYYRAAEIDQIELDMFAKTAKLFIEGDKKTIDLVKKYKQRVSSLAKERDAISAGENLNNSQNIGNQTVTATTLNDELLKQLLDDYNSQVTTILQEAVSTSPTLATFLRRITNGMNLLKDPISKSRYLSNSLKKFNKGIENIPKGELTDVDKDTYNRLKSIIGLATSILDEIDKRAAEKTFNAQRRKLDINANTQEWTAEDGKKYLFLTSETEHSVDEGVILHAIDVTENDTLKELDEQINNARKELNKYKQDAINQNLNNEERLQAVEKAKTTLQHLKNLIQDFENNLQNRRVEFKVSESREYLNTFTITNNQNKKITFENTLNNIIKTSDEILKDLVEKRKLETDNYSSEELLDESTGAGKSSPDWLEKQEEERLKKKDKFKAKAYAFTGTKTGVAYKNRLLNPHYAANQWYGSIQVQRWDEVKEFDFANAESEKGAKVKWSRPKAYYTFEKLLELCADKSDLEILDFIAKIKAGKVASISVNSFNNMINALPIGAVLFNNRLRTSNNTLMPTRLVMPDITSKDRVSELSDYEKSLRENMVLNLIRKTKKGETAKINVAQGNVSIFYKTFAQNTKSVVNQSNPILYDETGELLSQELLTNKYDSNIVNKNIISDVINHSDDFKAILDAYGFSIGDVFNSNGRVSIQIGDETVDALLYLLRGIAKYGDRIITENTLISNYIVPVFGKSKASSVRRQELAERLLDVSMDVCPNLFLSYDRSGGQSMDTRAQVEYALSNGYRIQLDITKNGDKIFLNPRSADTIIEIAEEIEGFLKTSNSRNQFLDELKTAGYIISKDTSKILANYFVYRKFNRLINPSNIVNVLTSGRAVPVGNRLIDSRQDIVVQDLISNVKALGLIYDEASDQFYYSADMYTKHIETIQKDETSGQTENDVSEEEQVIEEGYQNIRNLIESSPKVSVLKENVLKAYDTDEQSILAAYNSNNEVKSARVTKKVLVWYVDYIYEKQLEDLRVQQQITEDLDNLEEHVADDFRNKRYEPVVLAYATANGTIMRYDTYDNKMTAMANATGTPGAVYLVLPSFFNSNRNRVPVKLNPQHIDINVARVIAKLMYQMASGQITEDTLISNNLAEGLRVYQAITVKLFLNQLMYYGTEAIERNPSNANLDKLVYIKNKSIFYGNTLDGKGNEVTEENIEDFAQWISQNKNYRVDKDLLIGADSIVRGGYEIVDSEGNEVLSQNDGGNYITHLITSGMLMTDMDTSANSTIFSGNPQVYLDYTDHFKDLTPTTSTANKSTTSASGSTLKTKNSEVSARSKVNKLGAKPRLLNALRTFFYDIEISESLQVKFNDKIITLQLNENHRLTKAGLEYLRNQIDKLSGDVTFSVIVDGETLDFNDTDAPTVKLMSEFPDGKVSLSANPEEKTNESEVVEKTNKTKKVTTKETKQDTQEKDLDTFIEELAEEYDNTRNSKKLKYDAENYYNQHPELKQEYETASDFAERCFKLVLGGTDSSVTIEDILPGSRPASGLTPTTEKFKTNKGNININLNPVGSTSQPPVNSPTPISEDDKKNLLINPSYETAKYIIGVISSNKDFQTADVLTKKEMLSRKYLELAGNMLEPMDLLQKYAVFKNNIGEWLLSNTKDNTPAVFSAVKSFFKNFVRMENYDKAISRVKRILGDNFNFETYTDLPFKTEDDGTKMYIFGVCTANCIRLFRDAAKNKIKRGVAYHESFHRVSMLLLSQSERKHMYDNLYKIKPSLKNATEREKQEYLADMFAKWVLKQIENENPVYRFINKIGEYLRKLITRLRNGVGGILGRHYLHSLFDDMYKGKYAYMKASRENEEYFRLAFGNDPLYSSFKYNGQELANSAQQFDNIYRNLLAKILENTNMYSMSNGQIKLDYDALKKSLEAELANDKELISLFMGKNDIDSVMPVMNHATILQNILQPAHWKSWVKYLKLLARQLFSLEAIKDANDIDYSSIYEDLFDENQATFADGTNEDSMFKTILNDDSIKQSCTINQYSTLDADVRLFLYGVTKDSKLNSDGLYEYADVWQLWHELCHVCTEVKNTDEMIQAIKRYANLHVGETSGNTFRQLYELLNSDNTTDYIKNKLFSNVVKYINEFININYTRREDGGLDVVVENANQQKSQDSNRKRWQNALLNTINHFKLQYDNLKDYLQKKQFIEEMTSLKLTTAKDDEVFDRLYNSLQLIGIENVSQEDLLNFINKRYGGKIDKTFRNRFDKCINVINRTVSIEEDSAIKKEVTELFNPTTKDVKYLDNILLELSEFLTTDSVGSAKNDTVRIAKGAKAYIIGQYNHVTRFFKRLITDKALQNRYDNDYYTKLYKDGRTITYYGSKWLHYLKGLDKKARLLTLSGTVYNGEYGNSNDFMGITAIEDMLNKFSITISGNHTIPELANKKTYYAISNIPLEGMPISLLGTSSIAISDLIHNTFKGYLLSEIMAIRHAMQQRKNFVDIINKKLGTSYTYESLSNLSQEEQEKLFKRKDIAPLLGALRKGYHYTAKKSSPIEKNGKKIYRSFGINLINGAAYKSRHFSEFVDKLGITENTTDAQIMQWVKGDRAKSFILDTLEWNIHQVLLFFEKNKIISGYNPNSGLAKQSITNVLLPLNQISLNTDLKNNVNTDNPSSLDLIKIISYFVVNNMCDIIEFEKLVSGDIALYGSNKDSINKRYSAQTSTTSIKNDKGWKNEFSSNELGEDTLYNSDTYRVVEVNTTKIDGLHKYLSEAKRYLGVDAYNKDTGKLDYHKLIDPKTNDFTSLAKRGLLVQRYLNHEENNRFYARNKTHVLLALDIVADAENRLIKYRAIDPTDAQTWISANMNRRLKQSEGLWTDYDEACHNLLEYYDRIDEMSKINRKAFVKLLAKLDIDEKELLDKFNDYENNKLSEEEYAGYILGKTTRFIQGSLKYVFFGNAIQDNTLSTKDDSDTVYKIYDKTSLSPLYKIFCKGSIMEQVYNLMEYNDVQMIKMESCTKCGNIPSFELFDANGKIDADAFNNAPKLQQLFENLGRQLNTDPHESLQSTLLTQFMKIALMNVDKNYKYTVGDTKVNGAELLQLYQNVLDLLTVRGFTKFCKDFGVNPETYEINKEAFMNKLQDMAAEQGASSELVDALSVDNNDYVIHPAALPNINWIQSKLIAAMDKTVIKTSIPGKPMFQVASLGFDNITEYKSYADSTLRSYNDDGKMEVKLSISLFNDVLKQAGLANASFDVQRKFILENQDILFALSYRVPTQGQNSTLPIKIVDVFPPLRGDIIMFPADITTLTGSDFD